MSQMRGIPIMINTILNKLVITNGNIVSCFFFYNISNMTKRLSLFLIRNEDNLVSLSSGAYSAVALVVPYTWHYRL